MVDTLEGRVAPVFADRSDMERVLPASEGQDQFLNAGLALAAERRGLVPGPAQVYAYSVPPVLGGALSADNIELLDFVVWLSICGQMHR